MLLNSKLSYCVKNVLASNFNLTVQLDESSEQLDEIIVVGYGTRKKKHLTGAVSSVVNKEMNVPKR